MAIAKVLAPHKGDDPNLSPLSEDELPWQSTERQLVVIGGFLVFKDLAVV